MWSFLRPEPHRPLLPKEQIDPTYKRLRTGFYLYFYRIRWLLFSS